MIVDDLYFGTRLMLFPFFDETTAPLSARPILAKTKKEFKTIPNLEKTMALAPALLESYAVCWSLFQNTSLSLVER